MTPPAPNSKASLRKHLLNSRLQLSKETVNTKSARLRSELIAFLESRPQFTTIFFYMPIQNEPDVFPMTLHPLSIPRIFGLPALLGGGRMGFFSWKPGDPLRASSLGLREPLPLPEKALTPDIHTLILVPALGVSADGFRIGFGGGYYDRYLKRHELGQKLAVLFDDGANQAFVPDPWDIPCEGICTESGLIWLNAK